MDEPVHGAVADQLGERGFRLTIAGDHDHEVGKLILDLRHEGAGGLGVRLDIEHQDADLPRQQQVADLVRRRHVPQTTGAADGIAQGLHEHLVVGEDHQLHDVARQIEFRRVLCPRIIFGIQQCSSPTVAFAQNGI